MYKKNQISYNIVLVVSFPTGAFSCKLVMVGMVRVSVERVHAAVARSLGSSCAQKLSDKKKFRKYHFSDFFS